MRRLSGTLLAAAALAALLAAPGDATADDPTTPRGLSDAQSVPGAIATPGILDVGALQARAKSGDVAAETDLGLAYLMGRGTPRNPAEGFKWTLLGAQHGNAAAQSNLGYLYAGGIGTAKNFVEAAKWLRPAADKGMPAAETLLADLYRDGFGVTQDYAEAVRLYRLAIGRKFAAAEGALGILYFQGKGVPADVNEAARLFKLGAEHGDGVAMQNLALLYQRGSGVAQDNLLAYFWDILAAARPSPATAAAAPRRDALAKQLSPEQVAAAQEMARQWQPGSDPAALSTSLPALHGTATAHAALRGSGTGFVVSKVGYVLTNAHVVPAVCGEIQVKRAGEPEETAALVSRDTSNDLALLKIAAGLPQAATFRDDRGIRQGDSVITYGFPLTGALASEGNMTMGNVSALAGLQNDSRLLQISAPVQAGNSGGPLIDSSGHVVGVVVSKLNTLMFAMAIGDVPQNVNFAIKSTVARDFLEANAIAYETAASSQELKAADLVAAAKKYTVLVECRG